MVEKRQSPLWLDMSFEEALARFGHTDPAELPESIKLGKKAGGRGPPAARVDNKGEGGRNRTRKPQPPGPTG